MLWLYNLPAWGLGLLIVAGFVGIALTGLYMLYRHRRQRGFTDSVDNGTVGWFFSALTLFYGLLLGLLTVAAWGSYNQAASIASQEAATLASLYRDTAAYPKPLQDTLRYHLRRYVHQVIEHSWPDQRQGRLPTQETAMLNRFQKRLLSLDSLSPTQLVVHGETLRAFNTVVELRRQRLEALQSSVPGVIWAVVLLGAVATVLFSYGFVVAQYWLHATLTGILSAMIGLLIFLLVVLDHPYWGEVSVSADAYQSVLDNLMTL